MTKNSKPWQFVAALCLALFAGYVAQGLVRKPGWRANVAWIVGSWWRPADREARWQQAAGVEVDPWDEVVHGRMRTTPAGSGPKSQSPSSMGR